MFMDRLSSKGIAFLAAAALAFTVGCPKPKEAVAPAESHEPEATTEQATPAAPEIAPTETETPAAPPKYTPEQVAGAKKMAEDLGIVLKEDDAGNVIGLDTAAKRSWVDDYQMTQVLLFEHLKSLTLEGPNISSALAEKIAECGRLESLALRNTMIDDAGLAKLAGLKSLKVIDLRLSPLVQDPAAKTLAGFKGLKAVRVSGVNFTDAGLESLLELPNLTELDIRNCRGITPEGIKKLAGKSTLRILKAGGPNIDNAVLEVIGGMKNLTVLSLDNCDITDAGIAKLADLPLVDLTIYQAPNVTDKGLAVLADFGDLKRLTLRDVPTNGSALAGLPHPEKLTSLNLAQSRFADAEAPVLAKFANLESLVLSQTTVSDKIVDTLSKLTNLKTLTITETQISPEGVQKLQKALPGCKIRAT